MLGAFQTDERWNDDITLLYKQEMDLGNRNQTGRDCLGNFSGISHVWKPTYEFLHSTSQVRIHDLFQIKETTVFFPSYVHIDLIENWELHLLTFVFRIPWANLWWSLPRYLVQRSRRITSLKVMCFLIQKNSKAGDFRLYRVQLARLWKDATRSIRFTFTQLVAGV